MDGYEYEYFVASRLENLGWKAKVTTASGDQGVDVVAEKDGVKVCIQCKKYGQPVGNKAVQEAISGMNFIRADRAAVVTNHSYTRSAIELANVTDIKLLHHDDLGNL